MTPTTRSGRTIIPIASSREIGEQEIAHAISAHYTKWDVPYETVLDKALLACDELTGFIGACCLVRPEGVSTLKPKSVKKKLEDKHFAAKVERTELGLGEPSVTVSLSTVSVTRQPPRGARPARPKSASSAHPSTARSASAARKSASRAARATSR